MKNAEGNVPVRHAWTVAALSAALLATAACSGTEEASPPPTPQAALTTEDSTSAPDGVAATTAAPAPDDAGQSAMVDGPPELPDAATEQTEAGAEAFVQHYIDVLNYASQNPDSIDLATLNTADCSSCFLFTELLDTLRTQQLRTTGPVFEVLGFETE
ncbi:MAG: DUF6318 family protein, partial [Ornithinimicrobium sp.]